APSRAKLFPNVPNPFNPLTRIAFEMSAPGPALLEIFDTAGRRIATLLHEERSAGRHVSEWRGRDDAGRAVPSGVYFYRLKTESGVETRRMVLIR
ncbi:MAG: T9SS type A sorting domain-containing protein, partial [Gemmatimonadetes bacterium]|nr:T9SS type A sorting domain-containing protein [Gemmatimonadota bacterium]